MTRLMVAAIVLLVAALGVEAIRGSRARMASWRAAFASDSVQAARDTTHEVEIAALHDSVRVFLRRAEQQEQRADGLDRALGARRLAMLNARVRIAALDTVVRADTVRVSVDSARRSTFTVRREPYTVSGEVSSRPGDAGDSVSVSVQLDSMPVQVRVSCGPAAPGSVQRALAVVVAPHWAHVVLGDVEQSPSVCNPNVEEPTAGSRLGGLLRRFGIAVGEGIAIQSNGQVVMRPAILAGFRVWP
ncbi:MAG TPA: hypothetical protein VII52_10300 [Gemmatimonadaceae bacterium]